MSEHFWSERGGLTAALLEIAPGTADRPIASSSRVTVWRMSENTDSG